MMNNKYVRVTRGLADKGSLVTPDVLQKFIGETQDYYASLYYYTDKHKEQFQKTGSVKGITDVVTDKIALDFDCKDNLALAQKDAQTAVQRLKQFNILDKDIEVYFSGGKGFHVIVTVDKELTPAQAQSVALDRIGKDLSTIDTTLYNPSRVLRVAGTQHQITKKFKIPLTVEQLNKLSVKDIENKASSLDNIQDEFNWHVARPREDLFLALPKEEQSKKEIVQEVIPDLSEIMAARPSNWKDYKWALLNGFFKTGERHSALMVLAATYRAQGYDKELTYYQCKAALYKSQERYGGGGTDKKELWQNVIEGAVFHDSWKGGQYAPDENGTGTNRWLFEYCKKHGFNTKESVESRIISIDTALGAFQNYAVNIDKNTIKTNIKPLDEKMRFVVGGSYGVIGSPGSGKTSIVLQMLNGVSHNNQRGIFFSYDMFHAHVMQKLVHRHMGISERDIFLRFKNNPTKFRQELRDLLEVEYKNVDFCFQAGQTIQDVVDTIKEAEQKSGQKVKMIALDYNELISTDFSDPTQSSSYVAQKVREIANVHELCAISLFQPNKMTGDPSDEIKSYRASKGSSSIEQSTTAMIGISRPGFSPDNFQEDWLMTVRCVKNRQGPLFSLDLKWDGLRGTVQELNSEEAVEAQNLKAQIQARKQAQEKSPW